LYGDFIKIAQLRYKAGDIKKVGINTAQAKKGELLLQLQQNKVSLENTLNTFQALLNTSSDLTVVKAAIYQPFSLPVVSKETALEAHPIVQNLKQEMVLAKQNVRVEKAQTLPDFTVGYTNQSLMGYQTINNQDRYFGANYRFQYANVGIAIPLSLYSNAAKIKSLKLKAQVSEINAEQGFREMKTAYENCLSQYRQDLQQYLYFKENALPNAATILQAAHLSYQSGEIGYVEYLFALQTSTDIQLNYLKSIEQLNQSIIRIYSFTNQ
jgi:cobalt-zinc-cadmium resistance protein CzcA